MPKHLTCYPEAFAATLQELVADIPGAVIELTGDAVAKSTRKGVKRVKAHAANGGRHAWSGAYIGGFSSHVKRGAETTGEIGNKVKPGLVHLLEKGHATLTGRKTGAFPHMAPAFDDIKEEFARQVSEAVGRAIS